MRYFLDEDRVLRAKAAGRAAPLERWSEPTRTWVPYGRQTVDDVEFLKAVTPEEATRRLVRNGVSATEAGKAIRG